MIDLKPYVAYSVIVYLNISHFEVCLRRLTAVVLCVVVGSRNIYSRMVGNVEYSQKHSFFQLSPFATTGCRPLLACVHPWKI